MKFTAEQIKVLGNAEVHVLSKIRRKGRFSDFYQTQNTTIIYTEATITIVNKTFVPESALKRP
jgi:UDP-3-O-[3-hydroxymyristoyl] glucosamine N-acyltransferase